MAKKNEPIKKLGPNLYEVRLSTGWDPINKRYGRVSRRVHGTLTEARKVLDELRRQNENGIDLSTSNMSLGEFAQAWLERCADDGKSENTLARYRTIVGQIVSYIGSVKVSDVTPQLIDGFYRKLKSDRGISNTTLCKNHQVLKQILRQACDWDMILRNPCDRVKPPKLDDVDRRSLTTSEAARLLTAVSEAETEAYKAEDAKECRADKRGRFKRGFIVGISALSRLQAVRLGLATGMRRGEVLALTWGSLDLKNGYLTVRANLTPKTGIRKPKTRAGNRTVHLDRMTVDALLRWREVQTRDLAKVGIKVDDGTPVISDGKGDYLDPNNFSRWWRKFTAENGFDGLKFHELRHTQATLLMAQGFDVVTTSQRLGHSNPSITWRFYAHPVAENDRAAADMFGDMLSNPDGYKVIHLPAREKEDRSEKRSG